MNKQVLGNQVLCEEVKETEIISNGIILPSKIKAGDTKQWKVIGFGCGKRPEEFTVSIGDVIYAERLGSTEVHDNGKKYLIVDDDKIVAIVG